MTHYLVWATHGTYGHILHALFNIIDCADVRTYILQTLSKCLTVEYDAIVSRLASMERMFTFYEFSLTIQIDQHTSIEPFVTSISELGLTIDNLRICSNLLHHEPINMNTCNLLYFVKPSFLALLLEKNHEIIGDYFDPCGGNYSYHSRIKNNIHHDGKVYSVHIAHGYQSYKVDFWCLLWWTLTNSCGNCKFTITECK